MTGIAFYTKMLVAYIPDITNKTYFEKANTCSENTRANIVKNLFWDKKERQLIVIIGKRSEVKATNFCVENRR